MNKKFKFVSCLFALIMAIGFILSQSQFVYAASVKVDVVEQIKYSKSSGFDEKNQITITYKYNSDGLLIQRSNYMYYGHWGYGKMYLQLDYKYNSNNMVKTVMITAYSEPILEIYFFYNNKNQVIKQVKKAFSDGSCETIRYAYKNGSLSKAVTTYQGNQYIPDGTKDTATYRYESDSKSLTMYETAVYNSKVKNGGERTYWFDNNGFFSKQSTKNQLGKGTVTRKLIYKNNKLIKYQDSSIFVEEDGTGYGKNPLHKVSWKTIRTDKAISTIIKNQQREIINGKFGHHLYLREDYNY